MLHIQLGSFEIQYLVSVGDVVEGIIESTVDDGALYVLIETALRIIEGIAN